MVHRPPHLPLTDVTCRFTGLNHFLSFNVWLFASFSSLSLSLFFCLFLVFLSTAPPTLAHPSSFFLPVLWGSPPWRLCVFPSLSAFIFALFPSPPDLRSVFSFFVSSPPAPSISPSLNFCVSGSPDLFLSAFLPYVTPCASLSSMSASLWGCPSPPFCSHPPLSAHRREQQPCGPGDTPSLVARVLGPGRGCGLITLMVSAVGTQPAQEMGHLSLLELIAACGHFSPAAFRRRAERGERGSKQGLGASGEQWREGAGAGERGEGRGGEGGRKMPLHLRPGRSWKTALAGPWTPGAGPSLVHTTCTPQRAPPIGFHSVTPYVPTPAPTPYDHRCHQHTHASGQAQTLTDGSRAHSRSHRALTHAGN